MGSARGGSSCFGLRSTSRSCCSRRPSLQSRVTVCMLAPVRAQISRQGPAPMAHSSRSTAACSGAEVCFLAANCSASSALTARAAILTVLPPVFCVSSASERRSFRLSSCCTAVSKTCGDENCWRSVRSSALPPNSCSSCTSRAASELAMPGGSLSCAPGASVRVFFSANQKPAGRMALTAS